MTNVRLVPAITYVRCNYTHPIHIISEITQSFFFFFSSFIDKSAVEVVALKTNDMVEQACSF